jgi:DNA-binding transcriptional ArsR family regulator
MSDLMERKVSITQVIPVTAGRAKALGDPTRALMLDILRDRPLSVEELVAELGKHGVRKAPTTVRHHLEILKDAGLVSLARLEEARGAVLKYYAASARILAYEAPEDFDTIFGDDIDRLSRRLAEDATRLLVRRKDAILAVAEKLKDCPYCVTQHFVEFVVAEVLHRAASRAVLAPAVQERVARL